MTFTISKKVLNSILTLAIGFALGVTGTLPSNAEDPVPVAQGEILKVCINLKTGAIRVSNKCDSKTERKTVLGGTGAQGAKGDKGDSGATGATGGIGAQGPQGVPGAKGTDAKSLDLKLRTISFLASSTCAGALDGFELPVVTRVYEYSSTRGYAGQANGTLKGCSVTVYTP